MEKQLFNKNSVKRLAIVAGATRTNNDEIIKRTNEIAQDWLDNVLGKAITLVKFSGHKTINVNDIHYLANKFPHLITPFHVPSEFKVEKCKDRESIKEALKGKQNGFVCTSARPFQAHLHSTIDKIGGKKSFRVGNNDSNNTVCLLQMLLEEHLVSIFTRATRFMQGRETMNVNDFNNALL